MLDRFGKVVEEGDKVAYATMAYRSAELRDGEVISIETITGYQGRVHNVAKIRSEKTRKSVTRRSVDIIKI